MLTDVQYTSDYLFTGKSLLIKLVFVFRKSTPVKKYRFTTITMDHYDNNNCTDFDDTPLTIEFQEEHMGQQASTKFVQQDSQLTNFLRSSRHGISSNTQHTVSTFGSNSFGPTDFDDLDDEDSVCSEDSFDLPLNDSQHCPTQGAVNQALRISCDTVSNFDDSYETLQGSLSSFHEIDEDEEFAPETITFNESMSSMDAASEKLNACMERTAQSRMLIRMSQKQPVATLSREDSERSLNRLCSQTRRLVMGDSQRSLIHAGSRRGLLNRQDSNKSLSSLGNASSGSCKTSVSKAKGSFKMRMSLQRDLHRTSSNRSLMDRPRLSGI
jgi:hypothetical protein